MFAIARIITVYNSTAVQYVKCNNHKKYDSDKKCDNYDNNRITKINLMMMMMMMMMKNHK